MLMDTSEQMSWTTSRRSSYHIGWVLRSGLGDGQPISQMRKSVIDHLISGHLLGSTMSRHFMPMINVNSAGFTKMRRQFHVQKARVHP